MYKKKYLKYKSKYISLRDELKTNKMHGGANESEYFIIPGENFSLYKGLSIINTSITEVIAAISSDELHQEISYNYYIPLFDILEKEKRKISQIIVSTDTIDTYITFNFKVTDPVTPKITFQIKEKVLYDIIKSKIEEYICKERTGEFRQFDIKFGEFGEFDGYAEEINTIKIDVGLEYYDAKVKFIDHDDFINKYDYINHKNKTIKLYMTHFEDINTFIKEIIERNIDIYINDNDKKIYRDMFEELLTSISRSTINFIYIYTNNIDTIIIVKH
jgi:hypothetical protein